MKKFIITALLMFIFITNCHAYYIVEMEKGAEYNTEKALSDYNIDSLNNLSCNSDRDTYIDGVLQTQYDPDTFISWGLSSQLSKLPNETAEQKAIMALAISAFLDFANKINAKSRDNFLAIAASIGMTDLAKAVIAKAIELGADIND